MHLRDIIWDKFVLELQLAGLKSTNKNTEETIKAIKNHISQEKEFILHHPKNALKVYCMSFDIDKKQARKIMNEILKPDFVDTYIREYKEHETEIENK